MTRMLFPMKIFKFLLIKLITFYKKGISPFLPGACRFQPTCSEYMLQAIEIHGVIKGIYLGLRRIFRCHPWGGSGYDPVPPAKTGKIPHKGSD